MPHAPDPRPTRPDTVGVRQLLRTAQQWSTADTPGAARLSQEVLGLARQVCDSVGEGLALLRLSTLHRRHNDFALVRQAQALFVRRRDRQGQSRLGLGPQRPAPGLPRLVRP